MTPAEDLYKRMETLCVPEGNCHVGESDKGLVLNVVVPWDKLTAFLFLLTDVRLTRRQGGPGGT